MDATARQKLVITRLCLALHLKEDYYEERPMSKGEAGRLIRELSKEVKSRG